MRKQLTPTSARRVTSLLGPAAALLLFCAAAVGQNFFGKLSNFDVRYPPSRPNDLEIRLYGNFWDPDLEERQPGAWRRCITRVYNTGQEHAGKRIGWERPTPEEWEILPNWTGDPTSPGFGLDCIRIRYAGSNEGRIPGQLYHFGVSLRPGKDVLHQEVWWSFNGIPEIRACDPKITWICTTRFWIVCVENPSPNPFYIWGCRWFPLPPNSPLPFLHDLVTNIQPPDGSQWNNVLLPGTAPTFCLQPWCRIYLRIPRTTWRPIVFQIPIRNVSAEVLQLPSSMNPEDDISDDGSLGTMVIQTERPTEQFVADTTGDGGVGLDDYANLVREWGMVSEDLNPPDDGEDPTGAD